MKLNLGPEIDREGAVIIEKFVEAGWTQEDTAFVTRTLGGVRQHLVIIPRLLWYTADEDIPQVVVWYALRCAWDASEEDIREIHAPAMVEWLKAVGLTPFKDEDAGMLTHFRRLPDQEWPTFDCYVNPSYPKGLWENHTL